MRFVDTNVLLYATCALTEEAPKRLRALELLKGGDVALSVQVLQEFYYQSTRATRQARITHEQALRFLRGLEGYPVQSMTPELFQSAVAISQRFQISYWDAAILAAARALSCEVVYTEDLNPLQDYRGIRVINPFTSSLP